MADSLGNFKFDMKLNTYSKAADGTIVVEVHFEGEVDGFGVAFGTLNVPLPEGSAKGGSCTWTGQAFPPDRPWVVGSGEGTWAQVEDLNRWKLIFPVLKISDGSQVRSEGEIDLAKRTYSGQIFDAS